jgi:hypothetical protein
LSGLFLVSAGCSSSDSNNGGTPGTGGTSGGSGGKSGSGGASGSTGGTGGGSGGNSSGGTSGGTGGASGGASGASGGSSGSDAAGAETGASNDASSGAGDTGGSSSEMSFFITSKGMGKGGDLGGLAGADAHCVSLAQAAGAKKTKWAAYLSAAKGPNDQPVHARDRIGKGPWFNAKGVMIAKDLEQLHANTGAMNGLNEDTALDETGKIVPGRNEAKRPAGTMNEHDILTGSTIEGMLATDSTCSDWTSSAATGVKAQVGHSDKMGPSPGQRMEWNSAHASSGCAEGRAQGGVGSGGGRGSFYCFATE